MSAKFVPKLRPRRSRLLSFSRWAGYIRPVSIQGAEEMKPDNDVAAVANTCAQRRPWTAPCARRLAISAAESGGATDVDGIELLS